MESSTPRHRLIDARPPKERTRPMKVLCLGYLRTGTISLDVALKVLGYRPYHGKAIMEIEQAKLELPLWIEALTLGLSREPKTLAQRYGQEELDRIVGDYDALLEPSFLYTDFLTAYPNSKIILTIRPTESWIASMRASIFTIVAWDWSSVVSADPDFAALWWEYVCLAMNHICGSTWKPFDDATSTGGIVTLEAERVAAASFEKHNAEVRRLVPTEKLLEWSPVEGWAPLCDFLGERAPFVKAFPRVNDNKEFVSFHRGWFDRLKAQEESAKEGNEKVTPAKRCDTID